MSDSVWVRGRNGFARAGRGLAERVGRGARAVPASFWRRVAYIVPVLVILYYLLGMAIVSTIDDDPGYTPGVPLDGGARSVEMVVGLIERELDHGWIANDPFFYPGAPLDNMPSFQKGLFGALSRFTFELRDQIGRNRGSSASDPDLEAAAGNLSKEGDTWIINLPSPLPQTPSETYYRRAVDHLERYNVRVASGDALFERRADNLLATLDRIALDVGASSAAIESHIEDEAGGILIDTAADDLFYTVKGQAYGYMKIMEALAVDYERIIRERDLGPIFGETIASFASVAALDPLIVANGSLDGQMVPNHLAAQGFFLLRARTQLREVTNILLK